MAGAGQVAGWLANERLIVGSALALAVIGSAAFILGGGGTGMSALDMSRDTGPLGALLSGAPDMVMPMVWTFRYAVVVFIMWGLMMVAMMVPSAAPTILLYSRLTGARAGRTLSFAVGYLLVWAAFSALATALQAGLAALGRVSTMYMTLGTPLMGAAVLIGAGLYQVTPLKRACLSNCRGPVQALTRHRRSGRLAGLRMGMAHGLDCLGCCWALMALLFVGGVMNLWWVIALALYIAVEKLAPGGDRLARPFGILLVLAGLGLLARALL